MKPLVVRVGAYPHRVENTTVWERQALTEAGMEYQFVPAADGQTQIVAVRSADAVIGGGPAWPAEVIGAMARCRVLVSCSVGLDKVDVDAASARRIMVCNMPDLCTDEVADHAWALILACVRKVPRLHNRVTG